MAKVIGIDLGGTSVYGGTISENGEIVERAQRDTSRANGREEVLNLIYEVINELMDETILGIGIGSPGFIDSDEGKVLKIGGNIPGWAYTDIKSELSMKIANLPLFVENDANVAALCEHWIGAGKGLDSFVMITLGTGVGGAVYLKNGGILKGHRYQGGELGHLIQYPGGRKCQCGQNGCIEKYVSGSAIEETYKEKTGLKKRGKEIFEDSIEDKKAFEVVDEFTKDLAVFLVSLKNIFDPQGIIIGGGVINSRKYWWDRLLNYYKSFSNDPEGLKILPAIYLNDAGMIGAGKLVFDRLAP